MSGAARLLPLLRHAYAKLGRVTGDRSGVAVVEFAMILPVMILFYLGTVEITRIVSASAKVSSVSDTVGRPHHETEVDR